MVTGKVVLFGAVAAALLIAGLAHGSSSKPSTPSGPLKIPPPGDIPQVGPPVLPPAPKQQPTAPVPELAGKSTLELAELAGQDVDAYGWYSKRGVVAAFQKSWNATYATMSADNPGPPEAPLKVDDKWGPLTYTAATRTGASGLPPAYNPAP